MSRIDLSEDHRSTLCELLSATYASMVDLASQVHQARWTMRGAVATRALLEQVHASVATAGERLLLRIAALGGTPTTSIQALAKVTTLPAYDVLDADAGAHVEALADRFELVAAALRRNLATATQLDDPITAHVFAAVCESVEAEMARLERSVGD
jgi:starvation-inducible DNA-binding protein